MEKIILGLLMLRGMSIYDMKSVIDAKLGAMCSSSSGSIHTAINLLLKKGCIGCVEEAGEKQGGMKKKIYFITERGREEFSSWVSMPMNHEKAKNIEISKVFFMGMVEQKNVDELINGYIVDLRNEYETLCCMMEMSKANQKEILKQSEEIVKSDEWNEEGIKKNMYDRSMPQAIEDIYTYQLEILQYAIDALEFEIGWYQRFMERRKKTEDGAKQTGQEEQGEP